ncbi:MAG: TRAP transporter substrate-binding protein DctP, partial [Pseudomonadota bacterium]
MRLFFGTLASLLLVVTMTGQAMARCQGTEVPLRFAVLDAQSHPVVSRLARLTASTINVEMQGKACLTLVQDPQRFDGLLVVNALTGGDVELTLIELSRLTALEPGYGIFQLPFALRDYRVAERFVTSAAARNLGTGLERSGLLNRGIVHGGFAQLTGKVPLRAPSDLLGLKYRATPFDRTGLGAALRAIPQAVVESDLTEAIKDGRVEAQSNDWSTIRAGGHAKLHTGVTLTNHSYRGYALVVSKRWWDA